MDKDQLLSELKQNLIREIPRAVKEMKLKEGEKVCYISLFGGDEETVLALITLGIESYRDQMIEESGYDDKWYLWNSAEMPANYQVADASVYYSNEQKKLASLYEDEDWEAFWETCQTLRFEIAYELNTYDWSSTIPITDDFVVYSEWEAIDVINGDLERSIPKEKLQLLQEKGLI